MAEGSIPPRATRQDAGERARSPDGARARRGGAAKTTSIRDGPGVFLLEPTPTARVLTHSNMGAEDHVILPWCGCAIFSTRSHDLYVIDSMYIVQLYIDSTVRHAPIVFGVASIHQLVLAKRLYGSWVLRLLILGVLI